MHPSEFTRNISEYISYDQHTVQGAWTIIFTVIITVIVFLLVVHLTFRIKDVPATPD